MSTESKKHDASAQKLQKQREEGNVPNVSEISGIAGGIFGILCLIALSSKVYENLAIAFDVSVNSYDVPFDQAVDTTLSKIGFALALAISPLILSASAASIFMSLIYNKGIVFSMKSITPKLNRISPVSGFKRIFGKRTWIEVGVSILRILVCLLASTITIAYVFESLFKLDYCGSSCVGDIIFFLLNRLLTIILVLLLITILVEMILQKNIFLSEQRMTDSEVKKEQKENFGSNEVRQERNRLRQEDMQTADSLGPDKANMCFYYGDKCVGIRYHPEHAPIPQVTCKSKNRTKTNELRQKISDNGYRELEDRAVIETAFKTQPGKAVGKEAHKPACGSDDKAIQLAYVG